ncbi:Hypothetical predicted protein [Octopus vulgaris]|uniref:Uncharacterized protein n=1 Tax=Octopus vulgaris TaxID=6645 RepID=A0AA36APG0_OCTVU|nr:Hypothetical predicted protein [Octopus vulgaris]
MLQDNYREEKKMYNTVVNRRKKNEQKERLKWKRNKAMSGKPFPVFAMHTLSLLMIPQGNQRFSTRCNFCGPTYDFEN